MHIPGRVRDPGAFKIILTRTNIEGWRALKMLAVENDTTLYALAVEAFNDHTNAPPYGRVCAAAHDGR